jgi:hypothetical protein
VKIEHLSKAIEVVSRDADWLLVLAEMLARIPECNQLYSLFLITTATVHLPKLLKSFVIHNIRAYSTSQGPSL